MNRIKSVTPLPNMILLVVFQNGIEKNTILRIYIKYFHSLKNWSLTINYIKKLVLMQVDME